MSPRNRRRLRRMLELDDFERAAAPRLPAATRAYIANGAESGSALRNNRDRFADWRFVTRVLRNVTGRDHATTLFGHQYAAPFGIAPMGASAILAYDADNRMARAARTASIPYSLSANSITPMEEVIRHNPHAWFAAYLPTDPDVIDGMVDRVATAGFPVFVVTVDVPVVSNRLAEKRAGYSMPFRPRPQLVWDVIRHPRWLGGTFVRSVVARRGLPVIANVRPTGGFHIFSRQIAAVGGQSAFDWTHIDRIRRRWAGPLVLKGILSPEDAHIASEHGVDGIVVSNHGGRQLDYSVASIEMLSEVKSRSADMTVLLDSGIRRGTDILKSLALGADAVLIGRPFLYAAALAGEPGIRRAIEILARELDIDTALLGATSPHDITADHLVRNQSSAPPLAGTERARTPVIDQASGVAGSAPAPA